MNSVNLVNASQSDQQEVKTSEVTVSPTIGDVVSPVETLVNKETDRKFQSLTDGNLGDFLERPVLIRTTTLTQADTVFATSDVFEPWGLFLANPAVQRKTFNFSYINGTIQVIGVVSFPKGSYGRYVLTCVPSGGPELKTTNPHVYNCMQGDYHCSIDIAEAEDMAVQLPFIWQYDYASLFDTDVPDGMWNLRVYCLAPVRTGITGGITTGTIKWYANLMPGYELVVPRYQGKRKLVANHALKHLAPGLHEAIGEGKGSKMAGDVARMAERASSIPVIGAMASTVGAAARIAEIGLSWFGFTRETHESAPMPTINRICTNVAHLDGQDTADVASLTLMSEISIDPTLVNGHPEDILSNVDFFSRWTIIGSGTWSTTAVSGDPILDFYVSPSYAGGTIAGAQFTTAGYYGLPFSYWRGDMEYMLTFPISSFHRGSVSVLWIPASNTPIPALDHTNITHNFTYNIEMGEDLQFSVGYCRDKPYTKNSIILSSSTIIPVGNTNGYIVVKVLNPLRAQAAVASVNVTLLARAKNMDFAVPRDAFTLYGATADTITMPSQIIYQGKVKEVTLVPAGPMFPSDKLFFGEKIESLRALMQKPCRLYASDTMDAVNFPSPPPVCSGMVNPYLWTYATHLTDPFVGYSASERYKFFAKPGVGGGIMSVGKVERSIAAVATNIVNNICPITQVATNLGGEVTVPYYTPKKYVVPTRGSGTTTQMMTRFKTCGTPTALSVYYSLGPDIRIAMFREIPTLSFNAGAATPFFAT